MMCVPEMKVGPIGALMWLRSSPEKRSCTNYCSVMAFSLRQGCPFSLSMISILIFESSPPIQFQLQKIQNQVYHILGIEIPVIVVRFASKYIIFVMKVLGCIGAGAFGKVYKVSVQGQLFALKKIPLQFDCKDDSLDIMTLENQVSLLSELLYHPNVVRCYSSFRKNDHFCIVMEYAGHQTLDDLSLPLRNQKQIVNLIIQVAMGLRHLRNNKIIHRDIKPNNILISQKGLLKIADFGISKQLKSNIQTKTCLGTPYYAAPQIISQTFYDYSVDVWSFGVVLYEMIHGHLPFLAKNMQDLRSKIRFTFPQIRKDIHPDIKLILRGCLTKDPKNRFSVQQIFNIPLVHSQMQEQLSLSLTYF